MSNNSTDTVIIRSYLQLRRAIGYLGMALPFVLLIGKILLKGPGIEPSLSDYYYTIMRDVLVGSLWAFGIFFWSYKGYSKSPDNKAGNIACIAAVGTALFPTMPPAASTLQNIIGYFHYTFAITFLVTLAYFCLALFTKTDVKNPTPEKLFRNMIYKICGWTIIFCIITIIAYNVLKKIFGLSPSYLNTVVFWLETIAIMTFGFSWVVKGKILFKDRD